MTEDKRVIRSKRAIIEAAVSLMAERGVAATTIEAIAEQSGVAKTTIYRHWPDRGALVIDAIGSLLVSPFDPDTGDIADDLTVVATGLAKGLASQPWSGLLPSLIEAAERDPGLAAMHARLAESRDSTVRSMVRRARERGQVRDDIDDDDIVGLVAGPLFYRRMIRHEEPSAADAERIAALVAELIRHPGRPDA